MEATEARSLIERFTAAGEVPVLTADEVHDLVRLARGERAWVADREYRVGELVTPTAGEGTIRYRVITAGFAGATEPTWPVTSIGTVTDGSVVWSVAGPATFDVYGAAAVGWEWKAAKVAGAYDHGRGGMRWDRSQMYDHCLKQAAYYRARGNGTAAALAGESSIGRAGTITALPPSQGIAYRSDRGIIRDDRGAVFDDSGG